MKAGDFHCFIAGQRPDIEVHTGAGWLPGALRSWIRRGQGWWAHIDYEVDQVTHTVTVPSGRIRSNDERGQTPVGQPLSSAEDINANGRDECGHQRDR